MKKEERKHLAEMYVEDNSKFELSNNMYRVPIPTYTYFKILETLIFIGF